jgi:O-antigen ligase
MGCLAGEKDASLVSNDFIIMIFVLISFVPAMDVGVDQIGAVFFCSMVYFVLAYYATEHGGVRLLQILQSGTGSGLENGYDNHQGGLVGPIYAVFLYAIGAKIWFILALFMSLLGGKRVGVLAIIVGLVFVYLFKKVAVLKVWRNRFIVLVGALAIINMAASNLISMSEYEYERLGMDISLEEIMLGRYAIGSEMNRAIENRSLVESLVGSGPGSATALAMRVSGGVLDHPHNDWLRILHDYGILGSISITAFIALVFATSATGAVIAITNAIIMMTDNVIMYLYYQLPIVLMLAYSAQRESRELRSTGHLSR